MRRLGLKTSMEVLLVCSNPVCAYKPSDNLSCVMDAWAAVKPPMKIAAQRLTPHMSHTHTQQRCSQKLCGLSHQVLQAV
jgi:hypothetical protein